MRTSGVLVVLAAILAAGYPASARAAGAQAELRSAATLLPQGLAGAAAPTAPAGAIVAGSQPWICDASRGLTPLVSVGPGAIDPVLAVSTGGIRLPISPTTLPATCGQMAADSNGNVYVTQAIVDTRVTPSASRGILRAAIDPSTGAIVGTPLYIATAAGLDGDQPTAAAIGPDGNLYVAFLKNGNIKRIVNPASGTTQVVQGVGGTPNGHPGRALAFVGTDLYIGSADAFSVIRGATSAACTGGCNAVPIADGFTGVPHVGVASDGVDTVYFAVGTYNQVWRFTPSTGLFAFVSQGFAFVGAKTNLLTLDALGTLWIGDDVSNGTAIGAGRIWTIAAAPLANVTGGSITAGTNLLEIQNALRGSWTTLVGDTVFTPAFNTDGTFTATILPPGGVVTTTAGTWTLTPPLVLSVFGNPQGHLTLTDANGGIVLSGDVLLVRVDQLAMENATTSLINIPSIGLLVITKFAA